MKYFVLPVELGRQDGWFGPKRGVYLGGRLEVSCYDDAEGNDVVGVDVVGVDDVGVDVVGVDVDDVEDNDVVRGASWSGVMEVRQTSQFGWKAPTPHLFLGLALRFLPPPSFR